MPTPPDLIVVMPVYNESESIEGVLSAWCEVLGQAVVKYRILVFDDGSRDDSGDKVARLAESRPEQVELIRKANTGHGRTILLGYHEAVARGATWILQIDSDGQCNPVYFPDLWAKRETCDLVLGWRRHRGDGFARAVMTFFLRVLTWLLTGCWCRDANVPYRLMRATALKPLLLKIPDDCFFTNVALVVLAQRARLALAYCPVSFEAREKGRTTVSPRKLIFFTRTLIRNLMMLARS